MSAPVGGLLPADAEILRQASLRRIPEARQSHYSVTEEFIRGAEASLECSTNPAHEDHEVLRQTIADEILRQRNERKATR